MSVVAFLLGPLIDKRILEARGVRVGSAHRLALFVLVVAYAHHLWFHLAPLTQADATMVLVMLTGIGINEKIRQANPDAVIRALASIPGALGGAMQGAYRKVSGWSEPDTKPPLLTGTDGTEILQEQDLEPGGRPGEEDDDVAV